ncbi:MAG: hypothetical protein LVQ97_02430 [Candidatus Micrarchaeales archaeon]|jgi:hypothetical protein|uniref:Uncharacterized protein n=1 Tax=Candidatus Micrarchaeum acidiphilum ARMAN-2 TaxID=425595 RepID=C7DII9_MICA2|nr:MAG: hypothetical protein UNLARM2_0877 [Candidatus Micrarchaeum acidiphilum ARMAN-2]MCW6161018.1 hypothetical protein [Candidatus Micrarchaeales archaeon]
MLAGLLLPVIIHQFVSTFGYKDKEAAAETELRLMENVMEAMAKEEVSLSGSLINDEQGNKYVSKIELRKDEVDKLGLLRGKRGKNDKVDVIVTPVLRLNKKIAEKLEK